MKDSELLKDEPLGQKLIKKSFWLYFFTFMAAPAGYLFRSIVSNRFSIEEVGILYSALGFVSLLSVYNGLGLTDSLKYFLPKYWIEKKYNQVKTSLFFSAFIQIFTSILLAVVLYFSAGYLATHYFHHPKAEDVLFYFIFYFVGANLLQILETLFISFQNTFHQKLVGVIKLRSMVGFAILFFFVGVSDISTYVLTWVGGVLLGVLVGIFFLFSGYRDVFTLGKLEWDNSSMKTYIKYSLWGFVALNVGTLLSKIDQQMVLFFLGPQASGYYSNYYAIFSIQIKVVGPVLSLLFPLVSELSAKKDSIRFSSLLNFLYKYFSIFSLSIGALLAVLGKEVALVLFGSKFMYSGSLLAYSAWFLFFNTLFVINFAILNGIGEIKQRVRIMSIVVVFNIVGNLVFIKIFGLLGAIFTTVFGWFLLFLLSFLKIRKISKISLDFKFLIPNIVFMCFLAITLLILKDRIFLYENAYRYQNLFYLILVFFCYYGFIALFNYKQIIVLKHQLKQIRSK